MHWAAASGSIACLRVLAAAGATHAHVEAGDANGDTAVHCAASGGCSAAVFDVLQSLGATSSFVARNNARCTPALLAARATKGDKLACLRGLCSLWQAPSHAAASDQPQPAPAAAANSSRSGEFVSSAHPTDAQPQVRPQPPDSDSDDLRDDLDSDDYEAGTTPAGWRARFGASLGLADSDGMTPAHEAAKTGSVAMLRLLRERGAPTRSFRAASGKNSKTPAHLAASGGHVDALRELHAHHHGALDARTKEGFVPLHYAANYGHAACVALLHTLGCDLRLADDSGRTAAHFAATTGKEAGLRALAAAGLVGLDFEAASGKGLTPAHYAAEADHADALRVLKELGAEASFLARTTVIHPRGCRGSTPAMMAATKGKLASLQALQALGAGASFAVADDEGASPALRAAQGGHCPRITPISRKICRVAFIAAL